MRHLAGPVIFACLLMAGCSLETKSQLISPYLLSSWYENKVGGEIWLMWKEDGQARLEVVFIPDEGCHLYSTDLQLEGVDGLGRPTLIEVVPGGSLAVIGEISASAIAKAAPDNPGLALYPAGQVTLSLAIRLPEGTGWYDEKVAITYMACKEGRCYPPVEAKIIQVSLPGWEEISGE